MPSAFTAGVADGTVTDLRTFAMLCARGMGALVMMRDEPLSAPIPERFEPSTYHADKLEEARERLVQLKGMTAEEIREESAKWNAENDAYRSKVARENTERRERYDNLIAQTEAWEGAPEGLKEFMLEQLRSSRQFDTSADPLKYTSPPRAPTEWWAAECGGAARNVEYHAEQDAAERKRTEERNEWISQLLLSLQSQDQTP